MAFLVSPGVQVKETDLTNVIPATSSSIGAIAGKFQWGPAEQIVTVGSEQQLVERFGASSGNTFSSFFGATQFLSYGNALRVVRVIDDTAVNATAGGAGKLVKNGDHFDLSTFDQDSWVVGRFPGAVGNSIGVSIGHAGNFGDWHIDPTDPLSANFADLFSAAPGTSDQATMAGSSNDEIHVVVFDSNGEITGNKGQVLETYDFVSQANDAMSADGTNNYWKGVVNRNSKWIRIGAAPTNMAESGESFTGQTFTIGDTTDETINNNHTELSGGNAHNGLVGDNELILGYDMFLDTETVEVSLIIQSESSNALSANLVALADSRKDCVAFVSPSITDTVGNSDPVAAIKTWRTVAGNSSYAFADSSALYVYDKYHDRYRWILASGSMAGLAANADNVADPWWSPAGFSRGAVRNVTRLAFNPNQADRDDLYKIGVNPIVTFAGQGTILYGDKTLQSKPSAFDRINVRRLFITLEKAISTASKFQLFEFNDEFTRAQFRNMVEPFLRDVKGRRGITDFRVVCDETNNTGDVIDTNRFVADLYIKPARSINFITLNFIATRTGVKFSEIAGGN